MAKVWNYVFMSIMIILFTYFFGFDTGTQDVVGNITNVQFGNSTTPSVESFDVTLGSLWDYLWDNAKGVLLAVAGGLVVSFLARGRAENAVLLGFASAVLVLLLQVFTGVMKYAFGTGQTWAIIILTVIILPLSIGFIMALVEFYRGTD